MRLPCISLAMLAAGCMTEPPFARSNPLDEGSDYHITLSGPDSTHSLGERVTLVMHSDPPLPDDDYVISWVAGPYIHGRDTTQVAASAGDGVFEVFDAGAWYHTIYLSVNLGSNTFAHRLTIGQKAVSLELSCSAWPLPVDPCDDVPFDLGDTVTLHTRMLDALGNPIVKDPGFALRRGLVLSRDISVVRTYPLPGNDDNSMIFLEPQGAGATWVIVQIDDASDSMRVVVE